MKLQEVQRRRQNSKETSASGVERTEKDKILKVARENGYDV